MSASQREAARPRVDFEALGIQGLDLDRALSVPELAPVEVPRAAVHSHRRQPSEEDVAGRLHQPLAAHHALAVVLVAARARVWLQDRVVRLLELEEQRVVVVATDQEHDPGAGAYAAHPDDLASHVNEPVAVDELPPVVLEGLSVDAQEPPKLALDRLRALVLKLLDRDDQGESLMMRGSPSTVWVRRSSARRLSFARALATLRSNRRISSRLATRSSSSATS